MHKLLKVSLLLAVAVVSFSVCSRAQESQAVATNHVLKGTYLTYGPGPIVAAETLTAIGPALTVSCPGTKTCTIEADVLAQVGNSAGSANYVYLCATLDGVGAAYGCQQGSGMTVINTYVNLPTSFFFSGVAAGTHSVQMMIYAVNAFEVAYYSSTYRVYTP
jgi:hypothetical protein